MNLGIAMLLFILAMIGILACIERVRESKGRARDDAAGADSALEPKDFVDVDEWKRKDFVDVDAWEPKGFVDDGAGE